MVGKRISISILMAIPSIANGMAAAKDAMVVTETFDRVQGRLPAGWRSVTGHWRVSQGALVVESLGAEAYITFGDETWQNYEVEVSVKFCEIRNPSRWLSVLVRASPDGRTPWSQVPIRFDTTQKNGMEFAVRTGADQWSVRQTAAAPTAAQLNQQRRVRVVVRGSHVQGFLDGHLVVESMYCVDRPAGCVGLGVSGCVATFDDFSIRHLPKTPLVAMDSLPRCDNVAHRGFSAVAPENTLAAVREAIEAGASGCEFDVYACSDGTVVLMHDKTVDRTTNGTGLVAELTVDQLRRLDAGSWKHSRYTGEPVPTLTEALRLLKDSGCRAVIEIKMEGISKRVVQDIRALDMVNQVAVIAFSQTVVREVRQLEPNLPCAWLSSKKLQGTPAQRADWLAARARECDTGLVDLSYKMLSPDLLTELKRRGLTVWTWTVNEATVMRALRQWGVASITTDRPDVLTAQMR
jgi:glycerophosphoryl diester phosphodiesterase